MLLVRSTHRHLEFGSTVPSRLYYSRTFRELVGYAAESVTQINEEDK